jgi:hypothetical protein
MPNEFNFYKRAYAINQSYGGVLMSTSNISMGDRTAGGYLGLAKNTTLTYATYKPGEMYANFELYNAGQGTTPDYYINKFTTSTQSDQQAAYLSDTFVGNPVPNINEDIKVVWSQASYPSALGDIRDHLRFGNNRDAAWVEAGYDGTKNTINIYRADKAGGIPYFINTANVSITIGSPVTNPLHCRVFTSPGLITDNVSSAGGGGYPLIAFFAWDGGNTYYELFRWDISSGYGTLTSIFSTVLSAYFEFPYCGKHDIFYLSQWASPQTYTANRDYLLIIAGGSTGGKVYEMNLMSGALNSRSGDIANYSDVYDIILIGDNSAGIFYTYLSSIAGALADQSNPISGLNVFDSDYNPQINADCFFIGDDQQGVPFPIPPFIRGWLIKFDSSGAFNGVTYPPSATFFNTGIYSNDVRFSSGSYTLKRVVAVDLGQMVVGSGPNLGTQALFVVKCINEAFNGVNSFYKSYDLKFFSTSTQNEDFIAMNHLYCEDYTGYFDAAYTYASGYEAGLPVGAGNQHILSVGSSMSVCATSRTYINDYSYLTSGTSGYSDHFNYIIYLGLSDWNPCDTAPHTGNAYFYISVTGGSSAGGFQQSVGGQGGPANFPSSYGAFHLIVFYA